MNANRKHKILQEKCEIITNMSEQFADLGAAVILDPHLLHEGQVIKLSGQFLIVDRIVKNEHVFLKPLTGIKLWKYRFKDWLLK